MSGRALVVLVVASAVGCEPTPAARPCNSSFECTGFERCIDGICAPRGDDEPADDDAGAPPARDDAGAGGAGAGDAGAVDAGPLLHELVEAFATIDPAVWSMSGQTDCDYAIENEELRITAPAPVASCALRAVVPRDGRGSAIVFEVPSVDAPAGGRQSVTGRARVASGRPRMRESRRS